MAQESNILRSHFHTGKYLEHLKKKTLALNKMNEKEGTLSILAPYLLGEGRHPVAQESNILRSHSDTFTLRSHSQDLKCVDLALHDKCPGMQ